MRVDRKPRVYRPPLPIVRRAWKEVARDIHRLVGRSSRGPWRKLAEVRRVSIGPGRYAFRAEVLSRSSYVAEALDLETAKRLAEQGVFGEETKREKEG